MHANRPLNYLRPLCSLLTPRSTPSPQSSFGSACSAFDTLPRAFPTLLLLPYMNHARIFDLTSFVSDLRQTNLGYIFENNFRHFNTMSRNGVTSVSECFSLNIVSILVLLMDRMSQSVCYRVPLSVTRSSSEYFSGWFPCIRAVHSRRCASAHYYNASTISVRSVIPLRRLLYLACRVIV